MPKKSKCLIDAKSESLSPEAITGHYEKILVNLDEFYGLARPNLTGISRQRKDKAADFVNAIAKWESANAEGSNLVNKIANAKLEHVFSAEGVADIPESLEQEVTKLELVVAKFEEVVERLGELNQELVALNHLDSGTRESSCLTSLADQSFPTLMANFRSQFQNELKLKRSIYSNIAHVTSRQQMMFYLSAWNHQPFIDDDELKYALCLVKKSTGLG